MKSARYGQCFNVTKRISEISLGPKHSDMFVMENMRNCVSFPIAY